MNYPLQGRDRCWRSRWERWTEDWHRSDEEVPRCRPQKRWPFQRRQIGSRRPRLWWPGPRGFLPFRTPSPLSIQYQATVHWKGKSEHHAPFFSFKWEVYLKLPTRILCKGKFTRLFEEIRSVESELIKETEMKQNTQYNRCAWIKNGGLCFYGC